MSGVICSRAGCRVAARWRVEWRNPRIHPPERRKTWTACDEHVDYLRGFLASRSFPVEVGTLGEVEVGALDEKERGTT